MVACPSLARTTLRASRPQRYTAVRAPVRRGVRVRSEAADYCDLPEYSVPDLEKRKTMNALLLGAVGLPTAQMAYTYLSVLVPVK